VRIKARKADAKEDMMNGIDRQTAMTVMAGLVGGGVVMVTVGSASPDPQVASVLPSIGAALIAAGTLVLIQAESPSGRRAAVVGAALVSAGVCVAMIGSVVAEAAVCAALVPVGGALVAAGIVSLVAGTAALASRSALRAR
jgi:hypothetical protein